MSINKLVSPENHSNNAPGRASGLSTKIVLKIHWAHFNS